MLEFIDCLLCRDYETDNEILRAGSWKKFKKNWKNYQIYLFGTGMACTTFIKKYENKIKIEGVFDNSPVKWGTKFSGYEVNNPSEIKGKDNILVIITTTSYMDDIASQLDDMGFHNYYGLAVMESKKLILKMFVAVLNFILWYMLPVKKNRILISNGFRKYGDSPKAIVDELLKENVDCEVLWMNPDPNCQYPKEIKLVSGKVLPKIIAHATSKVWIDTFKKELWIRKKKSQRYINTWHGSVPIKKLDFDDSSCSARHLKRTEYDSNLIDLRISNSRMCTDIYRNAMKYKGEVLECGTPRLDKLFAEEKSAKVRERLRIPQGSSIILYAPTYRQATKSGFQGKNNIDLDFERLRQTLKELYKREVYILIKLHPAAKRVEIEQSEYIKDVTDWDDVYELLKDSDALISDYSSLVFEMGFILKPVYLYVNDYEQYKQERGVYFELDDLPFPNAYDQNELECKFAEFNYDEYIKKVSRFNEKRLAVNERGDATVQVVSRIKQYLH